MQRSSVLFLLFAVVVAIGAAVAMYAGGAAVQPRLPTPPPSAPGDDDGGIRPVHPGPDRGGLRVHVEVQKEAVFVPPPPERVVVRVAGSDTVLPAAVLAGEGAGFDPRPARPGTALVAILQDGGGELLRQVALGAEGQTVYRLGARVVVRGHVVDDDGWPLRGAQAWLGELDADGQRRTAVTDAEGAFELDSPDGDGVPFVVTAPGKASRWQVLTVAPPGPELRVVMLRGAQLDVQLAAAADDIDAARVFVVPGSAVATELAQYPFFLQALTDGHAVSATGGASIPDLPGTGTIELLVRHPRLPGMAAKTVVLRAPPPRAIVPLQFAEAVRTGRVVDADGTPLPGVEVWSRRPGQELAPSASARLLPARLPLRGACRTTSDGNGAFTVGALVDADALVSLRAHGFAGLDLPASSVTGAAPIVLPAWRGGDPAFRLLPPAPGVAWFASCDLGGGVQATLAPDQPWLVSFPHAGRFVVVVTTRQGEQVQGSETFAGVDATGVVDLQAPRLR
jgi:hypothetical protein